ncbi:MAG TPA: hypothetical protein VFF69_16505, partial [Phycisphaerales bacterium]|nr:hypothetical protein [Phycisphaerales bacterium]
MNTDTPHARICSAARRLGAGVLALLGAGHAGAQCDPGWIETPGYGIPGANGPVLASVMWDPAGPEPELLVVGGMFTAIAETPAANLAAWDGQAWREIGGGITAGDIFTRVSSLAVYEGELVVGGHFGMAGAQPSINIASWDGAVWRELGAGVDHAFGDGEVMALAEFGGKLIATGFFTSAGAGAASNIAAWDGEGWSPLGSGLSNEGRALAAFGGGLYVGGLFASAGGQPQTNGLAQWDGSGWASVGAGVNGGIGGLAVHGGALYVGGSFTAAGGRGATNIARWDGAGWS